MKYKKRKWCFDQSPSVYNITCDKCDGVNISWGEFENMIWCHDCKINTLGTSGIFDSPIPVSLMKHLNVKFDKIDMNTKKLKICVVSDEDSLEWISEKELKLRNIVNTLAEEKILNT